MTSSDWLELVLLPPEFEFGEDDPPDEQAARPAASTVTAPAASSLLLEIPLTVNIAFPLGCCDFGEELCFPG
jgi:hypothetical protein